MASNDIHSLAPAYAIDGLDPDDEQRFETHLVACERCRADVDAFRESATALAFAVQPADPPPALRERILTQARAERPNVVPLRPRRFERPTALAATVAALAACLAIGLGIWAGSLKSKLNEERNAAPRIVQLTGAEGTLAVSRSGQATLAVSSLPKAPAGKTYEVWVIEKTPKRAGLMPGGPQGSSVELERRVPEGATVAVTVERQGGVDTPTGKPRFFAKV